MHLCSKHAKYCKIVFPLLHNNLIISIHSYGCPSKVSVLSSVFIYMISLIAGSKYQCFKYINDNTWNRKVKKNRKSWSWLLVSSVVALLLPSVCLLVGVYDILQMKHAQLHVDNFSSAELAEITYTAWLPNKEQNLLTST